MIDLTAFAGFINRTLKTITTESFMNWNWSEKVNYPYIVYNFDVDGTEALKDVFEVTLNLFDVGKSASKLMALESQLTNQLDKSKHTIDEAIIYINKTNSLSIPTGNEAIQRREIKLSVRTYWTGNE